MRIALFTLVLAACYDPTIRDGQFTCSASAPACPSGFACDPCAHTCVRNPATSCGDMAHAGDMTAAGGGDMAVAACTMNSDCTGSACPPGSVKGCVCILPPGQTTKICAPACTTDSDCPPGPNGTTLHCQPGGNCGP